VYSKKKSDDRYWFH